MPAQIPDATHRWRCGGCGNLTRFDVTRTRRTTEFWHFDLAGDHVVEEETVRDESVESVSCRWCGRDDAIEVVDRRRGHGGTRVLLRRLGAVMDDRSRDGGARPAVRVAVDRSRGRRVPGVLASFARIAADWEWLVAVGDHVRAPATIPRPRALRRGPERGMAQRAGAGRARCLDGRQTSAGRRRRSCCTSSSWPSRSWC